MEIATVEDIELQVDKGNKLNKIESCILLSVSLKNRDLLLTLVSAIALIRAIFLYLKIRKFICNCCNHYN